MSNKLQSVITNVFAVALIVFVSAIYIKDSYSIKIVGDEFGYWSSAAWLSGCDWREVASHNEYYGFGYGLLLYFVFALHLGHRMTYQLALWMNVGMMICIYWIAYKLVGKIAGKLHVSIRVLIAMSAVLYAGILFYTQYTMAEIPICLLYWIIVYNIYCLLDKYSRRKIAATILLLVFCFFVHQRLLGLVVVGFVMLVYIAIKHKKSKDLFWIIPIFIVFFALLFALKLQYKSNYLSYTDVRLDANEFSGQASKISNLFSMEGIIMFVIGVLGKFFYACSGTFLLFFVFVVAVVKELRRCIKQKQISKNLEIWLFLFLVCLVSIVIVTIFLLDFKTRFDLLIYGRYFDFAISPIIVCVLSGMAKEDTEFKIETWMFVAYIALAWIVSINMPYNAPKGHIYLMCPAISYVLIEYNFSIGAVVVLTLLVASIFKILADQSKQNIYKKCASMVVAIVLWIGFFSSEYNVQSISCMPQFTENDEMLAKKICDVGAENNLYFYAEDKKEYICYLQFVMRDFPIHVFTDKNIMSELQEKDYILTIEGTELLPELSEMQYEQIDSSDSVVLWERSK